MLHAVSSHIAVILFGMYCFHLSWQPMSQRPASLHAVHVCFNIATDLAASCFKWIF